MPEHMTRMTLPLPSRLTPLYLLPSPHDRWPMHGTHDADPPELLPILAWCYGSCYQVQSKRTISVRIDPRLPPRPSKSTDFGWRRLFHAV